MRICLNYQALQFIALATVIADMFFAACSAVLQLAASTSTMKHQKAIIEMLLMAGALPNFSSRQFSYVGPSLSPLVEYLTYCENCDCTIVRLLLQYGARVSFRLPTRLLKIRQPYGVLGQVSTIIVNVMEAAQATDRKFAPHRMQPPKPIAQKIVTGD